MGDPYLGGFEKTGSQERPRIHVKEVSNKDFLVHVSPLKGFSKPTSIYASDSVKVMHLINKNLLNYSKISDTSIFKIDRDSDFDLNNEYINQGNASKSKKL